MFERIAKFLRGLFAKTADVPTEVPIEAPVEVKETPVVSSPKAEPPQSHRKEDHWAESQLAMFLDKYLYERFPTGSSFSTIRRIHDGLEQRSGIDVEFVETNGRVYCVDEKAQLHYLNRNLPTFAFEILSFQSGYDTVGWLCNSKLKTDLYMLVWPSASQDDYKGITWEQFTKADCLLIQKRKILKLLASKGFTIDRMLTDARAIRASGRKGKIPVDGVKGIYYFASYPRKYQEAPINIVVARPMLEKIAQRRYIVTKESVIAK